MIVVENKDDIKNYSSEDRPTDSLYAHLLQIEDVEVVLYFKYLEEDKWDLGSRSSHYSSIDVGAINATLGGGGHKKAAGATLTGPIDKLKEQLISLIEKALEEEH
jgi:phosphoesterase RecJ-like protein